MKDISLEDALSQARLAIRSKITDPGQIEILADYLRKASKFHYAGELYALMLKGGGDALQRKMWNKHLSFCLYKDPDLPSSAKFESALYHLRQAVPLETTRDAEFLGTAGAIYKRKWQYDNQFRNLIFAEYYYREGFESWKYRKGDAGKIDENKLEGADDGGYTAINYAFLADVIAFVWLKDVQKLKNAEMLNPALERLKVSCQTRKYIIEKLLDKTAVAFTEPSEATLGDGKTKWAFATLAEAYFGIGEYKGAEYFFQKYSATGLDAWQTHTTADQLMRLAEMQVQLGAILEEAPADPALPTFKKGDVLAAVQRCLQQLYPKVAPPDEQSLSVAFRGKVGLALSGGGFRAALFHVGVLARLAELDVLRHVQVLSCVSGGSIAGAYYYMLLKREMERHGEAMSQMHYIGIVREMEVTFLRGIQKNLRLCIFTNPWKNLRLFFEKEYTRTHRLGELYEKYLYRKIIQNTHPAGKPILMHTLKITPADLPPGISFIPKTDNWNRRNKVPILVLNATSLNTAHNWQFTASWMGEPPGNIQQDVDSKQRLRRMYYEDAPKPFQNNVRLGHAVGASSCVPVLFEPLMMKGLYPDIDLQLVDGGVHDNQGIVSLLEQECKVLIVSDASGQLSDAAIASGNTAEVFLRSDAVLQERIRESQLLDLKAREQSAQVSAVLFVHMKKELHKDPVNWKTCEEPARTTSVSNTPSQNPDLTRYGIRHEVQAALANIRTDLDAFNDAESYALMYSGYAQTKLDMMDPKFDFLKTGTGNNVAPQTWKFLDIEHRMQHIAPSENLLRRLHLGASLPLKPFKTSWFSAFIGCLLGLCLLVGMICLLYNLFWGKVYAFGLTTDTLKIIGWSVLGYLATLYIGSFVAKAMNWQNTLLKSAGLVVGAFLLSGISWLYLLLLNPVYLRFGKLTRLDHEDWLKKVLNKIWEFLR